MEKETVVEKVINIRELKNKFSELNDNLEGTKIKINNLQQTLSQEQLKVQQFLGAMQNTADLMVSLVGEEETQKIINSLQEIRKKE